MAFSTKRATINSKQWGYRSVTTLFWILKVALIIPWITAAEKSFVLELVHQNARFAITFPNRDMGKLMIKV